MVDYFIGHYGSPFINYDTASVGWGAHNLSECLESHFHDEAEHVK